MFLSCQVRVQTESTLYSCLHVKKPLVQSKRVMLCISDPSWTRTQTHLGCKRTLNHLAKLTKSLSRVLSTCLYGKLTICSYLATYVFQSESTLFNYLNVKKFLA